MYVNVLIYDVINYNSDCKFVFKINRFIFVVTLLLQEDLELKSI